ncbi:MarR family winged helix-turn-helix transcriptional regulator [Listeria ilorinensis]|uniref:MarR family winged helix-turn-helix transcriptional regulator n=1 Tax=Listeria ilorinensis TaxID=2867439 RepID=UPI001EF68D7E|nr:MarR family transcriptional regulator [Listeria ilorinensis]
MSERHEQMTKDISIIHRAEWVFKNERLKDTGLNKGQLRYLYTLYRHDGLTQETLAKRFMTDKANVTRHMNRLEELDLICRESDPSDKRVHRIFVTEKGWELQELIEEITTKWSECVTAGLSEQEKNELLRLLDKMKANSLEVIERGYLNERTE